MLIRGYNNFGFEAWSIPCLYMVGKYLRLFAIKSDTERSRNAGENSGGASLMQDDFDPETEKQGQLRDCEQHLKRIFTLCLNDRYVPLLVRNPFYGPSNSHNQGSIGRIQEMGHLLHYQPVVQDIL